MTGERRALGKNSMERRTWWKVQFCELFLIKSSRSVTLLSSNLFSSTDLLLHAVLSDALSSPPYLRKTVVFS
jgi:hypothetical protein